VLSEPIVSNLQLEAREDVFEAQASLVLATVQRNAAQHELLPTLNLETSVRGSAGLLSLSSNQFLSLSVAYSYPVLLPVGVSSSFSIGLNLSIPIQPLAFSGLAAKTRTILAAQGLLETTLALVKAEVTNKRSGVALARSGLELAVRMAEFSVRQLERVKTRALTGLVSILDLKRAELEVFRSQKQIINAQADLDAALLDFGSALAFVMDAQ
jgi:outer membrane protein TolC